MDGYRELANAIILQAVKDYRKILSRCKKYPCDEIWISQRREIEKFFTSDWFVELSNVDGTKIMKKLQEEFDNEC